MSATRIEKSDNPLDFSTQLRNFESTDGVDPVGYRIFSNPPADSGDSGDVPDAGSFVPANSAQEAVFTVKNADGVRWLQTQVVAFGKTSGWISLEDALIFAKG